MDKTGTNEKSKDTIKDVDFLVEEKLPGILKKSYKTDRMIQLEKIAMEFGIELNREKITAFYEDSLSRYMQKSNLSWNEREKKAIEDTLRYVLEYMP